MTYMELLNDDRFNYLIDKYFNHEGQGEEYKEYFKHFIENLDKNELIMPVLGVQGAGKSSFLNAILMDDNVLPTDVDETTCVPVEVKFGENTDEAIIYFHDKPKEKINIKELEKYVHNDYNEANKLNVSKIIIFNDSEILKQGLVLVDLPGVGSLTPENQKTTLDYVNRLAFAIFVIRTNPPITKTEKNFINALWPKLSNTIFVQNKWNDETKEDAEDAKEHNESVIQGISLSHNEDKEIHVNVVNVYEALKSKLTYNDEEYRNSGITNVIDEIRKVAIDYNKTLEGNLNIKIQDCFENIERKIQTYKTVSLNETKENEIDKEKRIEGIKDIISENKRNFKKIRNDADYSLDQLIENANLLIDEKIATLTRDLKRIINKGIVDGEKLGMIYKELSDKAINEIMDEVLNSTSRIIKDINDKLGDITIRGFNGTYENISFFNKESEIKYEKSLPSLLGLSGGLIGTITAASALGGPIGILAGMGIGIMFSILGDYMRQKIVKTRADFTMKDMNPMIEDLKNYLKEEILDDLRAKQIEIDDSIKDFRKSLEKNFKDDIIIIEKQYEGTYTKEHIEKFEDDLKLLYELRESFK